MVKPETTQLSNTLMIIEEHEESIQINIININIEFLNDNNSFLTWEY